MYMKVYTHVRNSKNKQCTSFLGADGVVGVECQHLHTYSMCIHIYTYIYIYVCVYIYTHMHPKASNARASSGPTVYGVATVRRID